MSIERYIVLDWLDGNIKEFDNLPEAKKYFDENVKYSGIECDCTLFKIIEEVKKGFLNECDINYKNTNND